MRRSSHFNCLNRPTLPRFYLRRLSSRCFRTTRILFLNRFTNIRLRQRILLLLLAHFPLETVED